VSDPQFRFAALFELSEADWELFNTAIWHDREVDAAWL
jgi:hypothetical protein